MSDSLLTWFELSWVGVTIRGYAWAFPSFEIIHFMGLCILFGSLLVIDLRLLGVARFIPMGPAMSYVPISIGGFVLCLITGIGFFCADPFRYWPNIAFRVKMILIILAGINALYFQFVEHNKVRGLAEGTDTENSTKFIAVASLVLWAGVIIGGRMIPYLE